MPLATRTGHPIRENSMAHVAHVPFTGLRIKEAELLKLGMSLPSLQDRAAEIANLPALGLLTLAGLTPDEWTQSYHESSPSSPISVAEILSTNPTLVALSALAASVHEAYGIVGEIRSAGVPVVMGGLHATACPEEVLQFCDSVVIGEGEPVWLEILADAKVGKLKSRYQASSPFDLSCSPLPRFDLLPSGRRPRMTVQTQRGCPFACDFCGSSRLLGPFREKPLEVLGRELDSIISFGGSRMIELADDNTFAGNRNVEELCDLFATHKIKYFTEADWRIAGNTRLLERLAASGCVQVLVGVESLVHSHSGMGVKKASMRHIMDSIDKIQDHGIAVLGCFIVGSDGETPESIRRLGDFLLSSRLAEIQLTLLTPFPGTALHARLKREGRLLPDRDWSHYTLFDVTFQPDRMSVSELECEFKALLRTVFNDEASRKRSLLKKSLWSRRPTR